MKSAGFILLAAGMMVLSGCAPLTDCAWGNCPAERSVDASGCDWDSGYGVYQPQPVVFQPVPVVPVEYYPVVANGNLIYYAPEPVPAYVTGATPTSCHR